MLLAIATPDRGVMLPGAGQALDIGSGPYKVFPHFHGVDNGHHWGTQWRGIDILVETAERMRILGSDSWDCVVSSHLLEHIEDYRTCLREWWRLVKHGGYLCLYLPHRDLYPRIGTEEEKKAWEVLEKDRMKIRKEELEEKLK